MLKIQHLTISDSSSKVLIDDLSFVLNKNEKIAVIGEEGNGKSTLIKAIYDPKMIDGYAKIEGLIDMQFICAGYLAQRLENKWSACFIYEYLLRDEIDDELDYNLYEEYEKICSDIQIDKELIYRDQKMNELSGGERVKLQLLKVLIKHPDCLLLDEPTNDIDMETIDWLTRFMKELKCAILFISHDIDLISDCADRILHLEQRNKRNKPVWTMIDDAYGNYVEDRDETYEHEKQQLAKRKREQKKKLDHINDIKNAVNYAQDTVPRSMPFMGRLLKKKMRAVKGIESRMDSEDFSIDSYEESINLKMEQNTYHPSKHLIHIEEDVTVADKLLVHDAVVDIYGQDKVAVIGNNGTGKSILLKRIRQELLNQELEFAYMPQNYDELLNYDMSAIDFLLANTDALLNQVQDYLGSIHLTVLEMGKSIRDLSEGQKAKVCIIYLILRKPKVLVMDEPTRNISPLSKPVLTNLLKEFQGCLIFTTHDRYLLREIEPRIYKIENKELKEVLK
ncbi:ATP-binding cassette domain-containing protein [Breznakia pachnodae]|uniref:ATPase subunit of ABC transporter with duplicated ATPase domains n=1 Tax=Breznakia pachnodae TaxID=265178 RepID=A0ABU0E6R1_9FIRM|nr:ATP-binding cassette domain-containing protein [Breznakia pachnodae]MDQ0362393.1 ATPase subunit of ABC transporter with duplicated ATPase domains [Breznakia pachnodae]